MGWVWPGTVHACGVHMHVTASYDNGEMHVGHWRERKQVNSWFRTGDDYIHVSLSTTGTGTIIHVWGYDGISCSPPPDSTQLTCPLWSF